MIGLQCRDSYIHFSASHRVTTFGVELVLCVRGHVYHCRRLLIVRCMQPCTVGAH